MRRNLARFVCLVPLLFGGGANAQTIGAPISQEPNATLPLCVEYVPLVQNGATRKAPACALGIPYAGTSPPTPLAPFQLWMDESTSPYTLRTWDGSVWVGIGTVSTSSHNYIQPLGNGGTGQNTALAARGPLGLNIDAADFVGDGNYSIPATDRAVFTNATLTAPRVWSLPPANAFNPGQTLFVLDAFHVINGSSNITLMPAGSDTVALGASLPLLTAGSGTVLVSDGISNWTPLLAPSNGSPPVGTAGGDLGGVYPNPTVVKLGGQTIGTFATANYSTPPPIGAGVPNAGMFSSVTDTGVAGSTQCLHANSSGAISGTGADCPVAAPGGSSGQVQINNSGAFGGLTLGGDVSLNSDTGAVTVEQVNGIIPGNNCPTHQWVEAIDSSARGSCTQPGAGDVTGLAAVATSGSASDLDTGTLVPARLPAPGASTLGGVESGSAPTNQFQTGISTAGIPTFAQPDCDYLSNAAPSCATDATNATNITSGTLPNARLSAVPNGALANSQITIAGHVVSLGGSQALSTTDLTGAAPCAAVTSNATLSTACHKQPCNASSGAVTLTVPAGSGVPAGWFWEVDKTDSSQNRCTVAFSGADVDATYNNQTSFYLTDQGAGFGLTGTGGTTWY